jgi:hypothetical protein
MRSGLTGKDNYIKANLAECFLLRLLSRELGVTTKPSSTMLRGVGKHRRKKRYQISIREHSAISDLAERHDVSISAVGDWLRQGRMNEKGSRKLVGSSLSRHYQVSP